MITEIQNIYFLQKIRKEIFALPAMRRRRRRGSQNYNLMFDLGKVVAIFHEAPLLPTITQY